MNPAHLDYDVLADLAEGLLADDDAASASEHLDGCTECRERSAEVADVSALLADIPVPPIPDDLAARIDDAIRAESMASSIERQSVASLAARRGRRHYRIMSAAAASVVVLGAGAVVGNFLLDNGRKADVPGNAAGPRAPSAEGAGEPRQRLARQTPAVSSGTPYTSVDLGTQIPLVVDRMRRGELRPAAPAPPPGCVSRVAGNSAAILVDMARYEGQPATIFVLPSNGGMWRVVVAGPDCSSSDPDQVTSLSIPSRIP